MKIGLCAYSGYKIYPGHGKTMVKTDGKTFTFLNAKCESSHLMKRNPRKVTWTVLYRAAKEQKKAVKAAKKVQAPPKSKTVPKQKASKVQQKSAPRVGGKR
ncbi:60S ribosomal protein L24 [Blattella germanica]|nr:60S ribosomal protein L24 [Blattella germanica]